MVSRLLSLFVMNDAQPFILTGEQPSCNKQIVATSSVSAKRKLVSLELRANWMRIAAIRKAVRLATGIDVGLEQGIVDARFRRELHYDPAHQYADNIAKVIEAITH
jgi:hypothetical protein